MKKILLLLILAILSAGHLMASYSTDWIKPADNYLKSGSVIARDKADNVIVAGYITAQNAYTRKYDKFGNFLWEEMSTSGLPGNYERPASVSIDKNKNIYVVGYRYTWSSGWEYPNAVMVLKYDAAGTLLWKNYIALSYVVGSSTGKRFNLESDLDSKGNLYIGTAGTSPAGFILIKLNAAGSTLVNTSVSLGTIHGFAGMRLKGSKVVATGTAEYNGNLSVVAWDTAGVLLWTKSFTGSSGQDVEMDGNGNVYILTNYPNQVSPSSGGDAVIYKYTGAGVQTWKKNYDFGGNETATRFTLVSGEISVIAYGSVNASYFDWITFQVSSGGAMLWNSRYNETTGNDEVPYAMAATDAGEVFVTGKGGPEFTQPNGSSYLRMVTLKYGSDGVLQWVDSVNIYSGWGIGCTLASDNSLFVLGGTNMTAFHFLDHTGTGSCGMPATINAGNIQNTSAKFTWTAVAGAYLYHLRYKTTTAADWTTVSTNATSIKIKTLTPGTSYNYAVEAICSSGPSGYTGIQNFSTTGTGYCTTGGLSTAQEYLSLVWIGGLINQSFSNNGYGDYTNLSTPLTQGTTVYGYLSAFLPFGLTENYAIWIDYNHDSDFDDAGEKVVDIASDFLGYIAVNFTVPGNATLGETRMRVTMKYGGSPDPCGTYDRGETEDYTVMIVSPFGERMAASADFSVEETGLFISPNPFTDRITVHLTNIVEPVSVFIYDVTGRLQYKTELTGLKQELNLSGLHNGIYFVSILKAGTSAESVKIIKQ